MKYLCLIHTALERAVSSAWGFRSRFNGFSSKPLKRLNQKSVGRVHLAKARC